MKSKADKKSRPASFEADELTVVIETPRGSRNKLKYDPSTEKLKLSKVNIFKSHVLFTNDGTTIWESKKKLASARRNQCKSWWNDEWRDWTLAAAATYLCDGTDTITLRLESTATLSILPTPLPFCSPVSYTDPQLLRFSEDAETGDDYGRDSRDDNALKTTRRTVGSSERPYSHSRAALAVPPQPSDGRPTHSKYAPKTWEEHSRKRPLNIVDRIALLVFAASIYVGGEEATEQQVPLALIVGGVLATWMFDRVQRRRRPGNSQSNPNHMMA